MNSPLFETGGRFRRPASLRSLLLLAVLQALAGGVGAQGLTNWMAESPRVKVFPPSASERSKPGVGKFIILTAESVAKVNEISVLMAGAWECIPSQPEAAITKRVEFGHSSWNPEALLNELAGNDSCGLHPRFVRLQLESGASEKAFSNLYDINYRTWEVRRIWQSERLSGVGVIGRSIFCVTAEGWLLINANSADVTKDVPFTPVTVDGEYWLVRKPGEVNGCWSYNRRTRRYITHFGPVATPAIGLCRSQISEDGRNRAWVTAPVPARWKDGIIAGTLILQRSGKKEDISIPVTLWARAGSGVPVIPANLQFTFVQNTKLEFRAQQGIDHTDDRIWSIDIATGKVSSQVVPQAPQASSTYANLSGVPVPEYLRAYVTRLTHFGRSGLAPAFLMYLGILKAEPGYSHCQAGVSPDGRHVFFRSKSGPLSDVYIYGDLQTKQTSRWRAPENLNAGDPQEFLWVETPR